MDFFIEKYKGSLEVIERNKKSGEKYHVSIPFKFGGRDYREVIYKKSFLGIEGKELKGILFIDGSEYLVNKIDRELIKFSLRLENIFDKDSKKSFRGFLISDEDMDVKEIEYKQIMAYLDILNSEKVEGCRVVQNVIKDLIPAFRENQEAVKRYFQALSKYDGDDIVLNEEILNELWDYYMEIYLSNFRKVKVLNGGRDYYENIRKKIQKEQSRFINLFIGMGLKGKLFDLQKFIDNAISVTLVYDEIIDKSEEDFIKRYEAEETKKIDKRSNIIRG